LTLGLRDLVKKIWWDGGEETFGRKSRRRRKTCQAGRGIEGRAGGRLTGQAGPNKSQKHAEDKKKRAGASGPKSGRDHIMVKKVHDSKKKAERGDQPTILGTLCTTPGGGQVKGQNACLGRGQRDGRGRGVKTLSQGLIIHGGY